MKLKLDFSPTESIKKLNLKDSIYLMGSCFSHEIGKKMSDHKFNVLSNPFGTIYNPHSICKLLAGEVQADHVVESHHVYYHWDTHGEISGLTPKEVQALFGKRLAQSAGFLKQTKWLIITLGSAWIYRLNSSGEIVGNCHKFPGTAFTKELLSVEAMVHSLQSLNSILLSRHPEMNIILTVSPVRHLRDGLMENNRSKGRLLEAAHQIVERYEHVHYFPSYEILIDELRDYRFYASDMAHPSPEAIAYIWSRFMEVYFDSDTLHFIKQWQGIRSALSHQPFQPKSSSHQAFLMRTLSQLEELNEKVDLSVEIRNVKSQLA